MKLNFHVPLLVNGVVQKDAKEEEFKESDIIYQSLNAFDIEDWVRAMELALKVKEGEAEFQMSELDMIEKAIGTPKINWPNFFRAVIKNKIATARGQKVADNALVNPPAKKGK